VPRQEKFRPAEWFVSWYVKAPPPPHPERRCTVRPPLSAVAKTVAVLEALAAHRHLSAIARATGLPTSTTHRILRELVALRWVTETEDHRYLFGPLLLHLTDQRRPARAAAASQAAGSPWGS
jgi:hypothetical protein